MAGDLDADTESAEPQALRGFDIERFHPRLCVVEACPQVKDEIFAYFAAHGYVNIERYAPPWTAVR